MSIPKPVILDISEWQTPATINYDKMAKALDGVIVRIQYGSNYVDKHYGISKTRYSCRCLCVGSWIKLV